VDFYSGSSQKIYAFFPSFSKQKGGRTPIWTVLRGSGGGLLTILGIILGVSNIFGIMGLPVIVHPERSRWGPKSPTKTDNKNLGGTQKIGKTPILVYIGPPLCGNFTIHMVKSFFRKIKKGGEDCPKENKHSQLENKKIIGTMFPLLEKNSLSFSFPTPKFNLVINEIICSDVLANYTQLST